jgi:hypothetical protein
MDHKRNGFNGDWQLVGTDSHSYNIQVHQATGMVAAQVNCDVKVALFLIVEHAARYKRSVTHIAHDVVERRLRFDGPAIAH